MNLETNSDAVHRLRSVRCKPKYQGFTPISNLVHHMSFPQWFHGEENAPLLTREHGGTITLKFALPHDHSSVLIVCILNSRRDSKVLEVSSLGQDESLRPTSLSDDIRDMAEVGGFLHPPNAPRSR